ncbi:MAG: glycosyltransferase family 2 protein [Planctomycetes bacterium]|nr:glycosyltransferase family 2 protein [Planctomycetota bacterium]
MSDPDMRDSAQTRTRVTACVITFNEEDRLEACLATLRWADALIVVDSHSTDGTVAIAERFGARVVQRPFPGHIEQKNFAADQADTAWVLSLDADERLTPELARELEEALRDVPEDVVAFRMPRMTRYLGRWIRHGAWYPDRKIRMWRSDRGRWGGVNPHDRVEVDGRVVDLRHDILHDSYRDVADHVRTINHFTSVMARARYERGERFSFTRLLVKPPLRFLRDYVLKRGFLDGMPGLMVALIAQYYVLLVAVKLWEFERLEAKNTHGKGT